MKRKVGGRIRVDAKVPEKRTAENRQKTRTLSFLEFILNISFHLLSDLNAFPGENSSKKKINHLRVESHSRRAVAHYSV